MSPEVLATIRAAQEGLQLLRAARGGDQSGGFSRRNIDPGQVQQRARSVGRGRSDIRERDDDRSGGSARRVPLGKSGSADNTWGMARSASGAERFPRSKLHKASSAEAILAHCLRQRGLTREWRAGNLNNRQRRLLLESVRLYGRAWMRHEAESFFVHNGHDLETKRAIDPSIRPALDRWFNRNVGFVQELMYAAAQSQAGAKLSPETSAFVAELTAIQREYLDQFHRDLLERTLPEIADILGPDLPGIAPVPRPIYTGPQAIARAEQYGNAAWQGGQKVRRRREKESGGSRWERRILGHPKTHHCSDCPPLSALGWQPIGTLPDIGDTECGGFCLCRFEYSSAAEMPTMKPKQPKPAQPKKRKKYRLEGTEEAIKQLLNNPQFNEAMKQLKITMKVHVGPNG